MTFKDELVSKLNEQQLDITNNIELIKDKLNKLFYKRTFTISLLETKPNRTVAIGGESCYAPIYRDFIPYGIEPEVYRNLYIDKLVELGFDHNMIEIVNGQSKNCYTYDIIFRW